MATGVESNTSVIVDINAPQQVFIAEFLPDIDGIDSVATAVVNRAWSSIP